MDQQASLGIKDGEVLMFMPSLGGWVKAEMHAVPSDGQSSPPASSTPAALRPNSATVAGMQGTPALNMAAGSADTAAVLGLDDQPSSSRSATAGRRSSTTASGSATSNSSSSSSSRSVRTAGGMSRGFLTAQRQGSSRGGSSNGGSSSATSSSRGNRPAAAATAGLSSVAAAPDPGSTSSASKVFQVVYAPPSRSPAEHRQYLEASFADELKVCSSSCKCTTYADFLLTILHTCSSAAGATRDIWSTAHLPLAHSATAIAAGVLNPAAGHCLAAAQDTLAVFREHVLLPVIKAGSSQAAAVTAGSRKCALEVAVGASKPGGLCGQLCKQLCGLRGRLQASCGVSIGGMQQAQGSMQSQGQVSSEAQAGPVGHTSHSMLLQQATMKHLLAQLLLVHQWAAALCRIWPSSIPDAKALTSLSVNVLSVAAELVKTLPHMQASIQVLSTASAVGSALPAAAKYAKQASQLAGPVTAAVLEVAAVVLEPVGWMLHQQAMAAMQGTKAPSMSSQAKALCAELPGGTIMMLLQSMLTVCLHQLVLHAERKYGAPTQQRAGSSMQQGAISSHAAPGSSSSCSSSTSSRSSTDKSVAELAGGYLLQHADTLQAKQPKAPSKAAVLAWRRLCEGQWAANSLPLTLEAAAAVLASVNPTADVSGSLGGRSSAHVGALWAMQECGTLGGHFGFPGQGVCGSSTGASASTSHSTSAGAGSGANTSNSTTPGTSNNTSCSFESQRSPTAVGSDPILSIDSCTHKVKALSALFLHLAGSNSTAGSNTSSTTHDLACSLLAIAAASVRLQGAAALPMLPVTVAAAMTLVTGKPPARPPVKPAMMTISYLAGHFRTHTAAAKVAVAATAKVAKTMATLEAFAAQAPAAEAAAARAVVAQGADNWPLMCLSLAADLTTAVMQLEGDPAVQPSSAIFGSFECVGLQLVMLEQLGPQACGADTATQLPQLQSVAYTLQLVEAAIRRQAVLLAARDPQGLHQYSRVYTVCYDMGFSAATTALDLMSVTVRAVLGSLHGQQLLQSCTSLLLTCCSLLQNSDSAVSASDLALCAQLLQLLQRSQAQVAASGSSSSCRVGVSQSLAAGLSLAGRCLLTLEAVLCPDDDLLSPDDWTTCSGSSGDGGSSNSSGSNSDGEGSSYSSSGLSNPLQQGMCFNFQVQEVLKAGLFSSPGYGQDSDPAEKLREEADTLQQAVHGIMGCVNSISQKLKGADVISAVPASASAGSSLAGSSEALFYGTASRSASTSSTSTPSSTAGSGSNAVQHRDCGQQQQAPADWLLAGVGAAQSALMTVLQPLSVALAPYLEEGSDPSSAPAATDVHSLPTSLLAAGEALCAAVPSSGCCNNPRCTNLGGVSAGFALVRGKGCVCGGCLGLQVGEAAASHHEGSLMAARYCSRDCQAAHRQHHKRTCCRLAQAAVATAAGREHTSDTQTSAQDLEKEQP